MIVHPIVIVESRTADEVNPAHLIAELLPHAGPPRSLAVEAMSIPAAGRDAIDCEAVTCQATAVYQLQVHVVYSRHAVGDPAFLCDEHTIAHRIGNVLRIVRDVR